MIKPIITVVLAFATVPACVISTSSPEPATPQRPTVSKGTTTTASGTVEIESGVVVDHDDRFDTPTEVKFGLEGPSELFVGFSPYQYVSQRGRDAQGFGDTTVGFRHRFWEEAEHAPAAAFGVTTKLPTGDEDDGASSGELDLLVSGSVSKTFENQLDLTGYYQLGFLGEVGDDGFDLQHTTAVAGSGPFGEGDAWLAEAAVVVEPESDREQVFLTGGAAFRITPDFVVDGAVMVGIGENDTVMFLFGVTKNLGRLGRSDS